MEKHVLEYNRPHISSQIPSQMLFQRKHVCRGTTVSATGVRTHADVNSNLSKRVLGNGNFGSLYLQFSNSQLVSQADPLRLSRQDFESGSRQAKGHYGFHDSKFVLSICSSTSSNSKSTFESKSMTNPESVHRINMRRIQTAPATNSPNES